MAKLSIAPGSTSISLLLFIQDSASTTGGGKTGLAYNTASLTCYYVRPGSAAAAVSLVTQTVTGAWSSGGFVEVSSTNMPGIYRFDVPNAVLAAGVRSAVVMLNGASGMAPVVAEIDLNTEVNLVSILGTALTETAGQIAAAFVKFFNKATPTGTVNSLPDAVAGAGGGVAIVGSVMGKSPATLAAADVSGNLPVDLQTIKTQTVTASAGVTFPASIGTGTSTYAGGDTPGTTELLTRIPDATAGTVGGLPTVDANNYIAGIQGTKNQLDDLTDAPAGPSAADIKTELEADGSKLDHLWEMTEDDGGVRRLTTNALEQAPTGAGTSDLDELLASHDTEDTLGNVINDLVEEIGGLYRLTAGALAMAPGGGATTYSYSNTVDDGSGNLLDGVFVQCATDSAMTNIVYTTHTNALGAYTVYSDTDGTHYIRYQLGGYESETFTVTLA